MSQIVKQRKDIFLQSFPLKYLKASKGSKTFEWKRRYHLEIRDQGLLNTSYEFKAKNNPVSLPAFGLES